MPPFAGDAMMAGDELAPHHHPAAATGAEDDAEHHRRPVPRPAQRLAECEAVGVVLDPHRAAQDAGEVAVEGVSVEGEQRGVLDLAACRADRPRNAHPHRQPRPVMGLGLGDEAGDGGEHRLIIGGRGGRAPAKEEIPRRIEDGDLGLGPAEIDADHRPAHAPPLP